MVATKLASAIAGRSCNGIRTPQAGAQVHQIAQVDGDLLYLGSASSGDGSTPEQRPTVLSKTPYMRRAAPVFLPGGPK
jgi:hypothetical protein